MEQAYEEHITFQTTTKDGTEVEMAVVDEFDFEHKHYVVAAVVNGDEISDDGRYIYRCIVKEDDFVIEKITKESEYNRVAQAYMSMDEME